jgi:hypothetical protein
MMTDEDYEAELQATTIEQWAAMHDKALADGNEMAALQHLMWRGDMDDWMHTVEMSKPGMSLEDRDYVYRRIGGIADRLREARDNPEKRERRRWFNIESAAAIYQRPLQGLLPAEPRIEKPWHRDFFVSLGRSRR